MSVVRREPNFLASTPPKPIPSPKGLYFRYSANLFCPHAIGIENCRKRLELLYPNRFTLIMKEENRQFKIRLSIQL